MRRSRNFRQGGGGGGGPGQSDKKSSEANLKNIFVSPYPTLFYQYGLVGRKIIFFNFSNWIPIKLNCIQ